MYEAGDFIVHPGQGVCRVDEVLESPQPTYMLMHVGARHRMRISFPVAGEARLRPVISHDEAEDLIGEYAQMDTVEYTGRSGSLEEEFYRDEIRRGTCRTSMRIVKTFRERIAEVRSRNKRPPVAYERILKQASQRSLAELAVALDVSTDDVVARFEEQGEAYAAAI